MKVLITTQKEDLNSQVDSRFGRGAYFLIVDTDTMDWSTHPNPGVDASGGAGVQAAQFVIDQGARVVVSGAFGPNAFNALDAAGIPMYQFGSCQTVQEVLSALKDGSLQRVETPSRGKRA